MNDRIHYPGTRPIPKQAQPSFYETTVAGLGKTAAAIVVTHLDVNEMLARPRWSFEAANAQATEALRRVGS